MGGLLVGVFYSTLEAWFRPRFLPPPALVLRVLLVIFFLLFLFVLFFRKRVRLWNFSQIGQFSLFRRNHSTVYQLLEFRDEDIL
jgi:hypothetical protein